MARLRPQSLLVPAAGFALYQNMRRQNDLKNAGSALSKVFPV
jgi:hypothetical protein